MYRLRKLNVVKLTEDPRKRDNLIRAGFTLVDPPSENLSKSEPHDEATELQEMTDFGKMTKAELRDILDARRIDYTPADSKAVLVELLTASFGDDPHDEVM